MDFGLEEDECTLYYFYLLSLSLLAWDRFVQCKYRYEVKYYSVLVARKVIVDVELFPLTFTVSLSMGPVVRCKTRYELFDI